MSSGERTHFKINLKKQYMHEQKNLSRLFYCMGEIVVGNIELLSEINWLQS